MICFIVWKNFDLNVFVFIGGTAPSRGMPLGDMLNPSEGGNNPKMPQGNNNLLHPDPNKNNESRDTQGSSSRNNVAEGSSSRNNVAEGSIFSSDDWRSGNTEALKVKGASVYDKLKELASNNKTSNNQGKSMNSPRLKDGLSFTQDDRDFVHRQMADRPLSDSAYRKLAKNGAIYGTIDKFVLRCFEPNNIK
jgi:hypothetical protein